MEQDPVRVGTAVIIYRHTTDGCVEILLGERCGELRPGVFALPGGKPDKWESLDIAITREAHEETGLLIDEIAKFTWIDNPIKESDVHYVTLVYVAHKHYGILERKEPDKCKGWDWYRESYLPEPLWPGLRPVLKEAFDML